MTSREQAFIILAQEGTNPFREPQKPTDGGKKKKKKKKAVYTNLFYTLLRDR
jgi:hypothetical protein